jgi:hypothetical protein
MIFTVPHFCRPSKSWILDFKFSAYFCRARWAGADSSQLGVHLKLKCSLPFAGCFRVVSRPCSTPRRLG